MLFYVALAIACFIAATVCLWLFRSMMEVGKSAYRAILPSGRNQDRQVRLANLNSNLADTPAPWGWNGSGSRRSAPVQTPVRKTAHRSSKEKVPWGWKGNQGLGKSNHDLISSGLESSAAVASVKSMLGRLDHHGNATDSTGKSSTVGWPYREESFDFGGRNYKVKRQKKASSGGDAKPWGW